ncbi:hypothetical protein LCGC14_1100730 [marine sediment metagenome]|uniref:Zinc-ribbon domain-containing protein n=1 Tax=marine sediment metagenome TaxID=412755 RepID=A0A0F9MXD5_9ZZZZ|nr:MAG: hypothetical protein Lokiarch_16280 [Candidatus Lokiarchaeum sp. GC14_75]
MPYCINCGQEIQESYNACPNCGKVLKEVIAPQPTPQSYPQPQAPIQVHPYQRSYSNRGGNTYGIVALILGLVGLVGGIYNFGIVLGIAAVAMGGIGLNRDDNNGMAIAGLILGILDIVLFVFFTFLLFSLWNIFWFF